MMITLYFLCVLLSVLILAAYCMGSDRYSINTMFTILSVIISNVGYYFLVISKSLDAAIAATRTLYVAGCFLPMLIFFTLVEVSQLKLPRFVISLLFLMQALLYSAVCTIGYKDIYYASMELRDYHGVAYLVKTYGPLHNFYSFTLTFYFVVSCVVMCIAFKRRHLVNCKNTLIIFCAYISAVGGYMLRNILHSPYEISPFIHTFLLVALIYPMSRTISSHYIQNNINRVYEQANDICFISFDMNFAYIGSNPKAKEVLPELVTLPLDKPIPETAPVMFAEILPRLSAYKNNEEYDLKYIKACDRDWEVKIHTMYKKQKKAIGYLVELLDVSDRLEYVNTVEHYNQRLQEEVDEKALRMQEMQQRMLMGFDHSETAYSLIRVEVDAQNHPVDWTYIYVNASMARLMGVRKEELVGKRFLETFPDGDKKWLNYYYPAAYEGKTFAFEATPQEIGIYMKVQCFPIDHGICGCVFEDVSTTKEIMRNKAELEMINDALCSDYTATYVVDMETGFTHLYEKNSLFRNMSQKIFVRGHYDDFSKTITTGNFVVESDKAAFDPVRDFASLKKTMSENQHYILNYRMVLHEQFLYYQTHFAMTYDGNRRCCIVALKNINDQMKNELQQKQIIEEALKKAEVASESKSTFLSNMSHEIRTPINAILGMDEMIIRECEIPEIRAYARNIQNAGKTLLGLINDILDFSKIESGKMEIIPVEYDLGSLINDLINMVRPKAEEKALKFALDIDSTTPALLYGDEIRIKQIILNILNNAVKYTEKGQVTLKIGYEDADKENAITLCVSVIDTGKGIKEEEREKLFAPFERLDEYNNRSIEGTGLGISITQNLLTMMGSHLEVSSVYGEGSTFSCRIVQEVRNTEGLGDIEKKYQDSLQAKSDYRESFRAPDAQILVVDDVQMNLFVVRDLLKTTKVQLDLALSGPECIELSMQKKYDLILLDHMMPEMDGFETLERLKEVGLNTETPVIILTANAISGAREKYMEAGFTDYLTKPIDSQKLENTIIKYLPGEKVITDAEPEEDRAKAELQEEDSMILQRLSEVELLDKTYGISVAGSKETYIMVCKEFSITGMSKYEQISRSFETGDISNYTIYVHGLKSVSKLIGCEKMAALAERLELAGMGGELEVIQENTAQLLAMLQQVCADLEEVFLINDNRPEISGAELIDAMNSMLEVTEAFDFDTVDMIIAELDQYSMPERFKGTYKKLKMHVSNVDCEEIINLIESTKDEWMGE